MLILTLSCLKETIRTKERRDAAICFSMLNGCTNHNMRKKLKNVFRKTLVFSIVGCLSLAGITAYFSDGDTTTNTFLVGQVSLKLQEPNWPGDTNGDSKDMMPNHEIAKDPQVYNDGVNEEFVFVTVAMPYARIETSELTRVADPKSNTELFSMLNSSGAIGVNDGWIKVGYLDNNNNISASAVYREDNTVTHLFAYGTQTSLTALLPGQTSAPVFNKVRFVNAKEDQGLEETNLDIVVNAYGIQTTNILDTIGRGNADGTVSPADVWSVVYKQSPTLDVVKESNPLLNPDDGSTPMDGDTYAYGDYIYTYKTDSNGWAVEVNTEVTDFYQTTYGEILESINGEPITDLSWTFYELGYLETSPVIPDTVTNMDATFFRCEGLKEAPVIPEGVIDLSSTFADCYALTTAPIIPNSVTDMSGTFNNCFNLKTYVGSTDPDGDFSNYIIPNGVTDMAFTFSTCEYLELPPVIPNTVTNMKATFSGCEILKEAPVIPDGVINMEATFSCCYALTSAPVIPSNVDNMKGTFQICTGLTGTVEINAVSPTKDNCFQGVDFETQNITLSGTSASLDVLGKTGTNYCTNCNGVCRE